MTEQGIKQIAAYAATIAGFGVAANPPAFMPLPQDFKVEDLERWAPQPRRKRGVAQFTRVVDLVAYVKLHATSSAVVWVDPVKGHARAILDFHGDSPSWMTHEAVYSPAESEELKRWKANDRKWLKQSEFADHVEDSVVDFVAPTAAEMLDIATTLQAKTSVVFRKSLRLDNGDSSLQFEETTDAKAGVRGDLEVPGAFLLSIALHDGAEACPVRVKLRYRISDGALTFAYTLVDLRSAWRDYVDRTMTFLETQTKCPAYAGTWNK